MGKLFRSWFKKKKKQESATSLPENKQLGQNEKQHTGTKFQPTDEALTFAHGSLLDDVLSGLKDHDDDTISRYDAPDSPPSTSLHAVPADKISQKNQINYRLSENNGSNIYQQSMVTQTPSCRPSPDSPSISPSTPTQVVAPPSSAATPSTTANKNLALSSLAPYSPSSSALPAQSTSHPNNALDQKNEAMMMTTAPLESGLSDGPIGHGTLTKINQRQQKPSQQDQQQPEEYQDHHEQHAPHLSVSKSPSIVSSKVSHDSNQEKRNRYLQATGVSMSRMKERHRQECRRSMQPNSNQLNVSIQQQPDQLQQAQPAISPSSHPTSLQPNHLGQLPQQIQQQHQQKLNQISQRHYLASPSMPALPPLDSISFYSPQNQSQQQIAPTIPAAASVSGTSFSPPPPAGTVPPNSIVRSSSLMTDIHQSPSLPDGGVDTSTPLPSGFIHQWRQQPLFPYQSDIVLPPYNPAQLNTIPAQQQLGLMMTPSTSSYRMNTTSTNHKQMFPRSASVYGGINQYHQQRQHDMADRVPHGGGFLRRTSMADSNLQPSISLQHHRKSMSSAPRLYKPQLSLSTLPIGDQQQPLNVNKSKRHCEASVLDQEIGTEAPSNDMVVDLPTTRAPCDEPKTDNWISTKQTESSTPTVSSSSASSFQQQPAHTPVPNDTNNNQQNEDSSNSNDVEDEDVAQSNSSCTINPSNTSTCSSQPSIKNDGSNGGLDEKLEIPSLVEHLPTKLQQQAELRIMKKNRQPHRRRRRFSLPTIPVSPSASSSSSSFSSLSPSKALGQDDSKPSVTQTQFTGVNSLQEAKASFTVEGSQKIEAPPSDIHTHPQPSIDHSTHETYPQGQQHQHHQGLPVPICSISSNNGSSPSHGGPWPTNGYHSCVAPLAVSSVPPCCPPSQQQNCQQHPHLHYHHQQPQHFHGHHHSCGHSSSIAIATPPMPSSCCSTPPYVSPPVIQPSCCSQTHYYRHHHHHNHHQRCQHRHSHHHNQPKQQIKKSSSLMTKVDQDDTATIRSTTTKSVLGQKGRQQQKKMMPPPSTTDADDEYDDDHTISAAPTSPEKKPVASQSVQRPLFRSFLPRPPRFSTSIPRPLQQQQQKKVKVSASKSTYSWIPSRS